MKKFLIAIILISFCYTQTYASTEGRIFLELENHENILSSPLDKIYQKNIEPRNIKEAFLHIKTTENILFTDINTEIEYNLYGKNGVFDITTVLKNNLENKKNALTFSLSSDFCSKNCEADKYPFIKIHYNFNIPPIIEIVDVLEWAGIDTDGKFLEYMVEISEDRFFQEKIILNSGWILGKKLSVDLQDGIYYWRVITRDNSFLNNISISETHTFEIKNHNPIIVKDVPIKKPIISSPTDNFFTNSKEISLVAKTDKNVKNYILLNNEIIKETYEDEIDISISLKKEGENIIKIISESKKYSSEASVRVITKWAAPSTPDFILKIENDKLFLKIINEDYEKAYIYLEDNVEKEVNKTADWIEIKEKPEEEVQVGIALEDDLGNKTEILYKIFSPHEEVLGIGGAKHNMPKVTIPKRSTCRYKYNITRKRLEGRTCNITKPQIIEIENTTKDYKTYSTKIDGVYNPNITILIDEYKCTWKIFCRERFVRTRRINASPYTAVMVYINNKFTRMDELRKTNKYFLYSNIVSNNNLAGRKANLKYHINHGFKHNNEWININITSSPSTTKTIPKVKKLPNTKKDKIFNFPFKKNVGVTQWHGYTAFQSPHTGIDFGSYKEPIYAIADGIIREAKWDNYSGKCLSGGYFVRIEHKNGMHSVYLHLENYKKSNRRNWKVGEKIKKGELIGKTGNSGAYNCQPLGYHLHFEIRGNSQQKNHINPVPLIDINWDKIHTLQAKKYPGRLTGNNPHPKW